MKLFSISKYKGRGQGHEILNCLSTAVVVVLKTLIFGRSKHLKHSSKVLANTFSDSLAISFFLSFLGFEDPT